MKARKIHSSTVERAHRVNLAREAEKYVEAKANVAREGLRRTINNVHRQSLSTGNDRDRGSATVVFCPA